MKRLLTFAAVLLFATGALAQVADRDVLVTAEGTVYTVERITPDDTAAIAASSALQLTTQNGTETSSVVVPESITPGMHTLPALAWDSETKTLFVLWLHMPNMMSSELLLAAYSDGKWQPAVSIDNQAYHLRYNLRIGITRHVDALQIDGTYADAPALLLHLLWWEETGRGEEARYALLDIEKGHIASIDVHSLSEFYTPDAVPAQVSPDFNREILRHPAFLDSGSSNSVDVIAGDMASLSFHRMTIKPILETRIRIPVGRGPGSRVAAPNSFSEPWTGRITVVSSPRSNDLVFTHVEKNGIAYLSYTAGNWSSLKSIETGPKLSPDSAMVALSKMLSAQ
jgi:hypothetical protein